jgi:hypothetical protein
MLGTAPDDIPSIKDAEEKNRDEVDKILADYQSDINRANLVTLGRDFTPEDVRNNRHRARYSDPRYLYAMYDEWQRMGPGPQKTLAVEGMKSANADFVTDPEDYDDDSSMPEDADPKDVANARAARDFLEDTLSPHLAELIEIHADQHFYGIADSKITLLPRGNAGKFDSIDYLEQIPARRHRLDPLTRKWMLMLSPDSWIGEPVDDLALRSDGGTEGLFFTEINPSTPLDQRGLFFQCLVPWGIQQYGVRWYAKYVELFGIPPRIAKVDFNHPQRVAEAKAGLKNMGSTSYGVFNLGTELQLLEASNGGSQNPFETIIDWCVRQYDQAILGHSQATGVQKGVGGKMSSITAQDQFRDLTNSRLRTFSAQITRNLGRILVARNLGDDIAREHSPIIRLTFIERDDPVQLATTALNLKNAGAGESIATEDLVRRCTLRVAQEGEKNLGALPTGAAATPPAGGPPAENKQALDALQELVEQRMLAPAAVDPSLKGTHVYEEVRKVIRGYMEYERKRAIQYAKKRTGLGGRK